MALALLSARSDPCLCCASWSFHKVRLTPCCTVSSKPCAQIPAKASPLRHDSTAVQKAGICKHCVLAQNPVQKSLDSAVASIFKCTPGPAPFIISAMLVDLDLHNIPAEDCDPFRWWQTTFGGYTHQNLPQRKSRLWRISRRRQQPWRRLERR